MNRRLTTLPGMGGIVGSAGRSPWRACARGAPAPTGTLPGCTDAPPAPPGQRPQRAVRRGVAVLHEVGVDDGLPVRAGPRPAARPRREQAAAADGPPHRVLHAAPASSCSTRSPASAARCSARPSRAARGGRSASSSTHAGRPCSPRPSRRCAPSTTARVRGSRTSAPTTRRARGRSTRRACEMRLGDARACPADPRGRLRRLRRHRPAVQRPAADDDGRRPARRDPREPADRLRDALATSPRDLANLPDYAAFLDAMSGILARAPPRAAARPLRRADRPRRLPGRPLPVHRRGPRGARRRGGPRPQGRPHLVPGRDAAAAVRLPARRSCPTSSTSTSWCCARSPSARARPQGRAAR